VQGEGDTVRGQNENTLLQPRVEGDQVWLCYSTQTKWKTCKFQLLCEGPNKVVKGTLMWYTAFSGTTGQRWWYSWTWLHVTGKNSSGNAWSVIETSKPRGWKAWPFIGVNSSAHGMKKWRYSRIRLERYKCGIQNAFRQLPPNEQLYNGQRSINCNREKAFCT
jgi:hypothetical protein